MFAPSSLPPCDEAAICAHWIRRNDLQQLQKCKSLRFQENSALIDDYRVSYRARGAVGAEHRFSLLSGSAQQWLHSAFRKQQSLRANDDFWAREARQNEIYLPSCKHSAGTHARSHASCLTACARKHASPGFARVFSRVLIACPTIIVRRHLSAEPSNRDSRSQRIPG